MKYEKCFLHVDMDAFFASVEQHDHPEWKGKPVIVGGLPGEPRSVVSTASYEARKFGVHSAMPVVQAYKLCPQGIYTHGNFHRYAEVSRTIMEILKKYSPDVNQLSIDEASVDITGTEMLFGPPEQIALQIQKDVLSSTGLTVSVGLASTRYLAKLSSEVNKPNGFFQIPPGKEEDFMLSLPLEKVWGIGKKTLERLNKCGFFTTRQIHQQPRQLLCNVFGENCGQFLYNTVRGIETEQQSPGTHSISAETTFPFDITDLYTAETQLLELCHTVIFRLKNEQSFSKTVMLKIRYDDFSTYTVQSTSQEFINTLDELFERAKNLLSKKYEKGRGIRLLGVGLENVMDKENAPQQEFLFDFGSKKKQAVEDAILKLSNRHPEIKIKKARLIDSSKKTVIAMLFTASLLCVFGYGAEAQEKARTTEADRAAAMENSDNLTPVSVEAAKTLFDKKIKNAEIEFLAQGYWQGEFTGGITASYGEDTGNEFSGQTPVFKQQVDMSLWFMINRQWYFQAAFADEFNKNTVAAGFYGKETNPLKEVKIANRGIVFPSTYSIELFNRGIGGGNNQAPGIFVHLEDPDAEKKRWNSHFVFRYDMTDQYDATYFGKNSLSTKTIDLSSYIQGMFFVLPETSGLINRIKAVYIENSSGSYKDRHNRKFKKISSEEYITVEGKNLLVISSDSGGIRKNNRTPSIIVEFNGSLDQTQFGSYSEKDTFLGQIQKLFGDKIKLSRFGYELFTEINGNKALLIQNSTGFSPFLCANYYDLGISSKADVMIGSSTTQLKSDEFNAEITEDFETLMNSSFFNKKHLYAQVYKETAENSRTLTPEIRYPLAKQLPGFYLGYAEKTDISLLVQTYTPVKNFDIGTDASAGSVRVYKNNVLDSGAIYNKETGTVTLSTSVSEIDKIYITWNQDSGDGKNGAIASEAAFSYNFTPELNMDIAAATSWTVSPYQDFAEYHKPAGGYATVETGISYKKESIEFSNAFAATLENQNVTSLYRIDGMENAAPSTYYLGKQDGYILKNSIIPQIKNIDLDPLNNGTQNTDATVGLTDSMITGYKIPLEWSFTDENRLNWAAVNIHLSAGILLRSGTEFRFALKNEAAAATNYDIYLQLGVEASENPSSEYPDKIPMWKITNPEDEAVISSFNTTSTGWQIIRIAISDYQRSCLTSNHDARLIVISKEKSKGLLTAGPYEIITQSIFTEGNENLHITSEQVKDNSIPDKSTFNEDDNYIQKIQWNCDSSISQISDSMITAAKYFNEVDISRYENFQFYFKYESTEKHKLLEDFSSSQNALTLTLDRNGTSISETGKIALQVILNKEGLKAIQSNKNMWHKFSVNLFDRKIKIDGIEIPSSYCKVFVNEDIVPTRFRLEYSTIDIEKSSFTKGTLSIDEISLDETSESILLQDIAKIRLEKKGAFLKAGDITLLENAKFVSRQNSSITIETNENKENGKEFSNSSSAEITVASIKLNADLALSSSQYNALSSAAQEVSTTVPLFGFLNFSDRYVYNPSDKSLEKNSCAALDFNKYNLPLRISGTVNNSQTKWSFQDNMKSEIEYSLEKETWKMVFKSSAGTEQKSSPSSSDIDEIEEENYFSGYKTATKNSFNNGYEAASSRKIFAGSSILAELPVANLSPAVIFETQEKYTAASTVKYSDTTSITAECPFTLFQNNFRFKYNRTGGGTELAEKGGNYGSDIKELGKSIYEHDFVIKSLPVYEMFYGQLGEDLCKKQESDTSTENLKYSGTYSLSWKRPVFQNIKDLFIPSSFQISAQREIIASSDSSDMRIYKTSILNTPFNLFGSQGTSKMFNWFKTDEYVISFSGTAKVPQSNPEDTKFAFSTYIQSGLYIKSKDVLKTGAEYSIQTDSSWSAEGTISYKRETGFSPVLSLCKLIYKKGDYSKVQLERTNSLDVKLNYTEEKFSQFYELSHKLKAQISSFITIYSSAATSVSYSSKNIFIFNLTGTIGGKIAF